ncbi:MAG: hypothetical protein KatS3mg085_430 [Candidatus Dojkabacteria bacterium]|nr:MAG: hypothetical protein KatS3mg085_430 [Candidatus Dojkabacteria bacterium]
MSQNTSSINSSLSETARNMIANYEMYHLPGAPKWSQDEFQKIVENLERQYQNIIENDPINFKITDAMLSLCSQQGDYFEKTQEILDIAPEEAGVKLANFISDLYRLLEPAVFTKICKMLLKHIKEKNLKKVTSAIAEYENFKYLPSEVKREALPWFLENAPKEAAPVIASSIESFPYENRKQIVNLLFDVALKKAVPEIAWSVSYLPKETRVDFANKLLDIAPKEAAPKLAWGINDLPEEVRADFAKKLIEKAPKEAAPGLANQAIYLPEKAQMEILKLILEKAPKEAAPELAKKLFYVGEFISEKQMIHIFNLLLDIAPKEAAPELAREICEFEELPQEIKNEILYMLHKDEYINPTAGPLSDKIDDISEDIRGDIAKLLVEKAPQESAENLAGHLACLPEDTQIEIITSLIEKAPKAINDEFLRNVAWQLRDLSEKNQLAVIKLLMGVNPKGTAYEVAFRLPSLHEGNQLQVARLLIDMAPKEAAPGFAWNFEYLPEKNRKPIEKDVLKLIENLEKSEIKEISKAEKKPPIITEELDNKSNRRVISNEEFISWLRVYQAVDNWKRAGFKYVPVEPILNVKACEDGKHVSVYTCNFGIKYGIYENMYATRKHHKYVKELLKLKNNVIVISRIGLRQYGYGCFILHERKPDGEIDWSKPPRIYCREFLLQKVPD